MEGDEEDRPELPQPFEGEIDAYVTEERLRATVPELRCVDFARVTHAELKVDTSNLSVSRLGFLLPNLTSLKLNNSLLHSLRDLGTGLRRIRVLWLARCGLTDLEGVTGFPNLHELYVAFNEIQDLSPLGMMENLHILDLESNNVDDPSEVEYLVPCSMLHSLTLEGNPVSGRLGYRQAICRILPRLRTLDDLPVEDETQIAPTETDELRVVLHGIKSARLDCVLQSLQPEIASAAAAVYEKTRPKTAGATRLQTPGTPGSPSPLSRQGSGESGRSGRSGGNGETSGETSGRGEGDGSALTFGTGEVMCGNPIRLRRSRGGSRESRREVVPSDPSPPTRNRASEKQWQHAPNVAVGRIRPSTSRVIRQNRTTTNTTL